MFIAKQGAKPTGYLGKITGKLMNRLHTKLYIDYFKYDLPSEKSKILDIGCGGGKFIKFLSDTNDTYKVFGLDHSPEMVELARAINEDAIAKKQVQIIQGSIANILVKKSTIDLITAFETVQFWSDIGKAFIEIERLLQIGGSFLIINRYPNLRSKWWTTVQIKSDEEYIAMLSKAGFKDIVVDLDYKKGWIIVRAYKV